MELTFTPQAARRVHEIMAEKGGNLALRIRIRRGPGGQQWSMTLEPNSAETVMVGNVPVAADSQTQKQLEGLVIDLVQTPDGPGFGVYPGNLSNRDWHQGTK